MTSTLICVLLVGCFMFYLVELFVVCLSTWLVYLVDTCLLAWDLGVLVVV